MAVLFYISWSRRLLEKVICEQSIEGRKGELRYLGEEWQAAEGRSSKKAWTEASKGCGEEAGDGSRAVEGLESRKELGFLWEETQFVHLWFPCPWILSLSINSHVLAFPCLLFFTFPQCKTSLDGFMSFILWFISLIWWLCPLLTVHFHTRVPKNVWSCDHSSAEMALIKITIRHFSNIYLPWPPCSIWNC